MLSSLRPFRLVKVWVVGATPIGRRPHCVATFFYDPRTAPAVPNSRTRWEQGACQARYRPISTNIQSTYDPETVVGAGDVPVATEPEARQFALRRSWVGPMKRGAKTSAMIGF